MIIVGQDWQLLLKTGTVLTGAATVNLRYVKPGGTSAGTIAGAITDETDVLTAIPAATNDTAGKWLFSLDIVLGGKTYYSKPVHVDVRERWHPWEV